MRRFPLFKQDYGSGGAPPPPPSTFNTPPPPPPSGQGTPSSESASSAAIIALVLGIASWICSLGLLTGIPAWIVGKKEINAINEGRSPQSGKLMAQIGMWLGIIMTIISIIAFIIFVLYFIFVGGIIFMNQ